MARPAKLTGEVQAKVVAAIKGGSWATVAAEHAGIAESTYHGWMARGRAELERQAQADLELEQLIQADPPATREELLAVRARRRPLKREVPFVEFLEAVNAAAADSELHATLIVRTAMKKDWKAAAWWLERRNPDNWRRRTDAIVHHEGPSSESNGGPVQIVAAVHAPAGRDDSEVARAAHDFLRVAGRPPAPPALDA